MRISVFFIFLIHFYGIAQQRPTKQFTTEEGLLSNDITALCVDSKGQLWVGSKAGLALKTRTGFRQDLASIQFKFNNVTTIIEDSDKGLWVGSYGQGILFKKEDQSIIINQKDGLISNRIRRLRIIDELVYVATNQGVSIIDRSDYSIRNLRVIKSPDFDFEVTDFFKNQGKIYVTTINNGLFEISDDKLIAVAKYNRIFSALTTKEGVFLGAENDLLKLDLKELQIVDNFPIPQSWEGIELDSTYLWVGSSIYSSKGGLYSLSKGKGDFSKVKDFTNEDLQTLVYDHEKDFLYIGTKENGLFETAWKAPVKKFLAGEKIVAVFLTGGQRITIKDNEIIFTNSEIEYSVSAKDLKKYHQAHHINFKRISTQSNHFFEIEHNLPAEKITIYQAELQDNKLWIATNLGVFTLGLNTEIKGYFPIHTYNFALFQGKFIETNPYGGVRIYEDIEKMRYRYFHEQTDVNIPRNIVSIAQDVNTVYFASALDGLYIYRSGKFTSLLEAGIFKEAKLRKVTVLRKNVIVVATDFNDIYEIDFSKEKAVSGMIVSHKKIKGSEINFLKADKKKLFIGTNLGLNILDNKKFYFLDKEQGLDFTTIYSGQFYANNLYLATSSGFYTIDVSAFKYRKNNIKPLISRIKINDYFWEASKIKAVIAAPEESINLRYSENNIRVYFDLLGVKYPGKLQFYYRLKKQEKWNLLSEMDRIDLHYLKPGKYELELRIKDLDSAEDEHFLLGTFQIHPPFYNSTPFLAMLLLLSLLIGVLIFKRYAYLLKRKQRRLQEIERLKAEEERKQLIFESRFAEVRLQALRSQMNSHFLFNVLSSLQYYILGEEMDKALYYLDQFAKLIRLTLAYASKEFISLEEELAYLKRYLEIENLRLNPEVKLRIKHNKNLDLQEIKIPPLLLQPFVENSLIHAFTPAIENPEIVIYIESVEEGIEIRILDNGIGIQTDSKSVHESMGLQIVEKRMQLIHGCFDPNKDIKSSENGTEIYLFLGKNGLTH